MKIGSDIEGFLINAGGKIISAIGLLGGSKEFPRKTENGWIQEDGVLAEYNIVPASTPDELINNIRLVEQDLNVAVLHLGLQFVAVPSAEISWDQLNSFKAKVAGCDPDYNAWNFGKGSFLNTPPSLEETNLRSASAHIHISWDSLEPSDLDDRIRVVKNMDVLHTVPSLFFDEDERRRKLYGKAGSFRFKSYGIECRSSSNWWVTEDRFIEWTFNQAKRAIEMEEDVNEYSDLIINSINNFDKDSARKLINTLKIEMP